VTRDAPPPETASAAPDDTLAADLVRWQRDHGRHGLPWQDRRDPYRVWLSEIMLQQTQVTTVLGYYGRFLDRFPDVASLARASQDEVLALWSGLGYYSRARNLHRCAQAVVRDHGGHFPPRAEALALLPGIGRSTAAAIAAFCFGERVAILDGNVKRVLSRVLAFGGDLAVPAQERALWAAATTLLPAAAADMPDYTQGLMDLGATVCASRSPQCLLCPLQARCRARQESRPEAYPVRTRKLKRHQRQSWLLWLTCGESVWLQRRPDSGIWAGLWSLPDCDSAEAADRLARQLVTHGLPGVDAAGVGSRLTTLPAFLHVLTHLDWTLHPLQVGLPSDATARLTPETVTALLAPGVQPSAQAPGQWWPRAALDSLGLPAPVRKLLTAG
jgi:A/G-specific adenine glycosylase